MSGNNCDELVYRCLGIVIGAAERCIVATSPSTLDGIDTFAHPGPSRSRTCFCATRSRPNARWIVAASEDALYATYHTATQSTQTTATGSHACTSSRLTCAL